MEVSVGGRRILFDDDDDDDEEEAFIIPQKLTINMARKHKEGIESPDDRRSRIMCDCSRLLLP